MAYGKIKSDTLVYDNSGTDVEIAISGIPTAAQLAAKQDADPDTAKTDVAQTFTAAQRGDIVDVTGTTPSFDLNACNNFKCTTSGNLTTFTLANLKNGEFAGACAGQNPMINKNDEPCGFCGKTPDQFNDCKKS